ncbi:surface antigen-domain-containing protein [Mycena belliarum]|uniref:Surface antigen-domain-containing protein n=1 Tax=Mycena belliarum TaxID=1033014 RepID=A0AAD6U921_9AGAR|nr:surface antigen-domain-containing protein [Mycena belliae]
MDEETPPPPKLRPPLQNSRNIRDFEPDERDLQKIRDWQKKRVEQQLQGQYTSAVQNLADVIEFNRDTPLRISDVHVDTEGERHTRPAFLYSLIEPLIPPPGTPSTLNTTLHTVRSIADVLHRTGIFERVDVELVRARAPLAGLRDVDLAVTLKEKNRFTAKSSTEVGNNEGTASLVANMRNAFGGAETMTADISLGTTTRRAFNVLFTAPLTSSVRTFGELHLFGTERDHSTFASCTEGLRGARALVRSGTMTSGLHELAYEAAVRNIGSLLPEASLSMREAAGQSVKSALSHTFTLDTRGPERLGGVYLKTLHEFAGLGGSASFLKSETHAQVARAVGPPGVSVSLGLRSGLLWGLGGRPTLFPDRFQLGGPANVRAFRPNGLGPRDGADAVGGDVYWAAGLSVMTPLPKKLDFGGKTHAWINAGRLDSLSAESLSTLVTRPSVSAGVGLSYAFGPVRLELNFGVPLLASKGDGARRGVQLCVGAEFL